MLIIECINKKKNSKQIELKFNVTGLHKLPPHLAKPLLYTIRHRPFDFMVGWGGDGVGAGAVFFFFFFFFLKIFIVFSSDRKPEISFFHSLRAKIFFSDLYVRVFLEPNIHGCNIHGYIVYMFVLGPRLYVHIKTFFNFSCLVTIYPVDALHFT